MHQNPVSNESARTRLADLQRQHRQLDEELLRYELHVYLTPEEEQTRRELQKRKLALKDQMAALQRADAYAVS